jgi:Cupin domain
MRKTLLLLGVGLAGVVAGALGATYVGAQGAAQVTRTELLRKPISGIEGKEVIVFVADLPPGAVAGRHAHPGDEAIYMLQGALRFQPEGGQYARGKGPAADSACELGAKGSGLLLTAQVAAPLWLLD